MAKRKRRPDDRSGFKLNLGKDYRSERYVMYIVNTETGILQASTIDPTLTDGEVSQALEDLMVQLKEPDSFTKLLPGQAPADSQQVDLRDESKNSFIQHFILINLRAAFERHGPLDAEDVIGILGVIKTSVKRWSIGMHRRGYLTFLEGFLGQAGVRVQQLTEEEAEELGLKDEGPHNYLKQGD